LLILDKTLEAKVIWHSNVNKFYSDKNNGQLGHSKTVVSKYFSTCGKLQINISIGTQDLKDLLKQTLGVRLVLCVTRQNSMPAAPV